MTLQIRVRLFAIQRELAGTREVALELPDGADVEAAWDALVARLPGARSRRSLDAVRPERGVRRSSDARWLTATRWR